MKKFLIVLAAVTMLAAVAAPVQAEEMLPPDPSRSGSFSDEYMGEKIIFDVYIMRPVGFAASLIGLGLSVGAYPMASLSGSTDLVTQELVERPWNWTFCRPVGDVDF